MYRDSFPKSSLFPHYITTLASKFPIIIYRYLQTTPLSYPSVPGTTPLTMKIRTTESSSKPPSVSQPNQPSHKPPVPKLPNFKPKEKTLSHPSPPPRPVPSPPLPPSKLYITAYIPPSPPYTILNPITIIGGPRHLIIPIPSREASREIRAGEGKGGEEGEGGGWRGAF